MTHARCRVTTHTLSILCLSSACLSACGDDSGGTSDGGAAAGGAGVGLAPGTGGAVVNGGGGAAPEGGAGGQVQGGAGGGDASSHVYVESNDPAGNAILAFARSENGEIQGESESYDAGGLGIPNPTQALGPDDSDQNLIFSSDEKRIFAVNSGSDTVAVFDVSDDGSLSAVPGSPFPSGGKGPVSVGLSGDRLYVVNRGREAGDVPNYVGFDVGSAGGLTPIAGAVISTSAGASPSHALISPNGELLFGADFMGPMASPPQGALRALIIGDDGTLGNAPASPVAIPDDATPAPPFALGLAAHPTEPLLYVGLVTYSQLGVYSYAENGALTLSTTASNSGAAICWLEPTSNGERLYTSNSGSGSISVYDTTTPTSPVEVSVFELKNAVSGLPFVDAMGMPQTVSSSPFQLELSPKQDKLYVVSQRVTTNPADLAGNYLHELHISSDGSLSEPGEPLALPVPITARPQGVIVR